MRKGRNPFLRDEGGFTTPAAAVALLVVLSLLFMGVDGYRVSVRSGQIQYVADAGALAADGAVAEFVTAGQVVDAALLSLSLLGITVYAASAVAAFVPGPGKAVATTLAKSGKKILKARDKFAKSAKKGLKAAQKALPALCAVRAAQVVSANAEASGEGYVGIAVVNPVKGAKIELADDSEVESAAREIKSEEKEVKKNAEKQQRYQEKADQAKERGWKADCGSNGMNMRERAGHLASLSGSSNPNYSTVDTWSFSVPLARAKAYYRARRSQEAGAGYSGSAEEVGESIARKKFYEYALGKVSEGRVGRSASGSELPELEYLARNTAQIRETYLYTESAYPLSKKDDELMLHAWTGCPAYSEGTPAGSGSVAGIDSGSYSRCETCKFSATTLGRVPAASTSISNGFEYYYRIVVEASREYSESVRQAEDLRAALEESRKSIVESLKEALGSLAGERYDPQPPGRYGCICIVYAPEKRGAALPFLSGPSTTPARVAISGATLAPGDEDEQGVVVSEIAEGLVPSGSLGSTGVGAALSVWGSMLKAYTDGVEGVEGAFTGLLSKVPLVGNELSERAATSFRSAIRSAGLEPADLRTYKPVLVNTSQVVSRGDGALVRVLKGLKSGSEAYAAANAGDLRALVETLPGCPDLGSLLSEDGLSLASFPLVFLGLATGNADVTVPAPENLGELYAGAIASALAAVGTG